MMRQPGSGHPSFATFDVEDVDKADGRKVHYYSWRAAPDGDPEPGAGDASDAVDDVRTAPGPATSPIPAERSDRV